MANDHISYSSDQILVPLDYGTARCLCGGLLVGPNICTECHAAYDTSEVMFWNVNSIL